MKHTNYTIYLLFLLFTISACSTGNKAYKNGNYYDATIKAVKNLRSNPDSKKSKELIAKSYPMALNYNRQKVEQLSLSNSEDKYFSIVQLYKKLNTLADEISRCPAALEVVKPVTYFNKQLNIAQEKALEEQLNIAKNLLQSGHYVDARMALKRLEWVHETKATIPNLDLLLTRAHNQSIMKTVIEIEPELRASHNINSEVFYNRLINFLKNQAGNEFTRFYEPQIAEDLKIKPHQILKLQFVDFKVGQITNREKETSYESDSIAIGTYTTDDGSVYDVFGTVNANVISYERELLATGVLQITIEDYMNNETIKTKRFPGEYFWKNYWATYNGDVRALPAEVLELSTAKQKMPPSPQEMFLTIGEPIYSSSTAFLKSYYKKQ